MTEVEAFLKAYAPKQPVHVERHIRIYKHDFIIRMQLGPSLILITTEPITLRGKQYPAGKLFQWLPPLKPRPRPKTRICPKCERACRVFDSASINKPSTRYHGGKNPLCWLCRFAKTIFPFLRPPDCWGYCPHYLGRSHSTCWFCRTGLIIERKMPNLIPVNCYSLYMNEEIEDLPGAWWWLKRKIRKVALTTSEWSSNLSRSSPTLGEGEGWEPYKEPLKQEETKGS
jgi:hypothetical protein